MNSADKAVRVNYYCTIIVPLLTLPGLTGNCHAGFIDGTFCMAW